MGVGEGGREWAVVEDILFVYFEVGGGPLVSRGLRGSIEGGGCVDTSDNVLYNGMR